MFVTSITNKDSFLLYLMAALAISRAWVNGVFEVETFADGITLDDLVAHCVCA